MIAISAQFPPRPKSRTLSPFGSIVPKTRVGCCNIALVERRCVHCEMPRRDSSVANERDASAGRCHRCGQPQGAYLTRKAGTTAFTDQADVRERTFSIAGGPFYKEVPLYKEVPP